MAETQVAEVAGATVVPGSVDVAPRILESTADAFQLLDADWHLTYMNSVARQFWIARGMDPDAMLGRHLWNELFPDARNGESAPYILRAMNDRVPIAYVHYYGPWDIWVFTQLDPLPDGGLACFYADVSEEKHTEAKLRQSEALLAEAQQLAQIGSWNFDLASNTVQWSDEHYRLFGLGPHETALTYDFLAQHVHPDDRVLVRAVTARALRDHRPFEFNVRTRTRDGVERVLCARGQVVLDELRVPLRLFGTTQDITERVAAERALRESEERYRSLTTQVKEFAIFSTDVHGVITSWNEGCQRVLGYTEAEFVGLDSAELYTPEDRADGVPFHELRAGATETTMNDRWMVGKNGHRFFAMCATAALRASDGRHMGFSTVLRDVTERKRYQDQLESQEEWLERLVTARTNELERTTERLRRSERMASLGTLAAGLGHDVGNLLLPLEVRLGFLDRAELGHDLSEHIVGIRKCVDYLRRLSNGLQLLAVDPGAARSSEVVELSEWWNDVSTIIENVLPDGVQLEHSFPAEGCWITMSPVGLTQAVFNLVQNAADAMRERNFGHVTLSAVAVTDGDSPSVVLKVIDDGPGMPEEVVRHCMEPYFSTKTRGVTTGMGLSMVHGMVEAAGGRVEVDSTVGRGTTVRLHLPVVVLTEEPSVR
jgi:PAS domain S-box-containing protein